MTMPLPSNLNKMLLMTVLLCVGCAAAQDAPKATKDEPVAEPHKIVTDEDAASERLLPFCIVLADQYRAAHRLDESIALYEQLHAAHPNNFDVIIGRAKTLRALGRTADAMAEYNKVINLTRAPYTEAYWRAWLCRLELVDKQCDELAKTDPHAACRKGKTDIYLAVRRLELAELDKPLPKDVSAGLWRLKVKYRDCDPGPEPAKSRP
ncbi:MAG: tetratricopeptide repeat protein [Phycisphaera sp.]|nr:tetratricopeptide repeat protein [Phycisphaera sp.]